MAESRITEYNKKSKTVSWFYNDHKYEKRHDVTDNVIDFEYIKLDRDKSTFKSHRDFSSEIEITFKHL